MEIYRSLYKVFQLIATRPEIPNIYIYIYTCILCIFVLVGFNNLQNLINRVMATNKTLENIYIYVFPFSLVLSIGDCVVYVLFKQAA